MSDIQFKSSYRDKYAQSEVSGPDLPMGFFEEWNKKFRAWEERRGLVEKRGGFHYGNQTKVLRGAAARSVKSAKKKKAPGFSAHTNIIGKSYATRDSGMRAVRRFVAQNPGITRDDFEVRKIDWGCYKVVQKDDTKVIAMPESSADLISDEEAKEKRMKEAKKPSESFLDSLEKRFAVAKI